MSKTGTAVLRRVPTRGLRRFKCPDTNHHQCVGKVDGSFPTISTDDDKLIGEKNQNIGIGMFVSSWKSNTSIQAIENNGTTIFAQNADHESTYNNTVFMFSDYEYRYIPQILAGIILLFYLLVLFIVAKNMTKLHNSFYSFVLSLGLVDTSCLLVNAIEIRALKDVNTEPNIWIYIFSVQFLWYCNIFNVLGLTITRFMVIIWHRKGEKFLSTRNILIGLVIIWISAFALAVPILFPSQRYALVDEIGRVYYWDLSTTYFLVENVISICCISFSMVLYFLMFVKAKTVRSNAATTGARSTVNRRRSSALVDREEYKILLQSFVLTACMTLCLLTDYIFYITADIMVTYAFTKFTVLLNYGINPFLYVIFSSQIRGLLFCMRPSGLKTFSSVKSDNTNGIYKNPTMLRLMSTESRSSQKRGSNEATS